jgi:hypothetical protein
MLLITLLLLMLFCALVAAFVIRTARDHGPAERFPSHQAPGQSLLETRLGRAAEGALAWVSRATPFKNGSS